MLILTTAAHFPSSPTINREWWWVKKGLPQVTKGKGKTAVRQREGAIRIWLALTQLIITFISCPISSLVRARGRIIILWNASIDLLASTHHMSLFWLMKFEIEKSTTKNFIPRLRFYLSVKWLVFSPSSSFSSFQIKFAVHRRASKASIEFMFSRLAVVWPAHAHQRWDEQNWNACTAPILINLHFESEKLQN